MREKKFTPGEWFIEPRGKGETLFADQGPDRHPYNLVSFVAPDGNWEANKRLIAASLTDARSRQIFHHRGHGELQMAENSKIEWTDHTFNPWIGCTKVSPGCAHCYAERDMDQRRKRVKWGPHGTRVRTSEDYWKQPLRWNRQAAEAGVRHRVFCASLADVFESPGKNSGFLEINEWRQDLFALIDSTPHLDWLLLTKRPENVRRMWPGWDTLIDIAGIEPGEVPRSRPKRRENVWLGTSVEDQQRADERIPELLACRELSPVLFLSMEPLLGPVAMQPFMNARGQVEIHQGIDCDWVIVGGESGHGARPMHPDWARSIRDQCQAAGVPFFFKQWGEYQPATPCYEGRDDSRERGNEIIVNVNGSTQSDRDGQPNDLRAWFMRRVGKKAAGRLLDGVEHNGMPEVVR